MSKREYRFGFTPEIRGEESAPKIVGYAAMFNEEADLGYFREVIKPGAFKRSISTGADVRALVEHDPAMIIGRSTAGSLSMSEDDKGLRVEITPPDTTVGRDVVTNLRNGNLDKMSFGFYIKGENKRKVDGQWLREITDVDLFDVSVVAFPAYDGTSVQARSLFPDGQPELSERAMSDCVCDCAACKDGNCDGCTHEGCDCAGCTCDQEMQMEMNSLRKELETRTAERDHLSAEVVTLKSDLEASRQEHALKVAELTASESRYFDVVERSHGVAQQAAKAIADLESDFSRRLRLKTIS